MHGAGNDFVVLDCTKEPFSLTSQQLRFLADRHFGVGADQILVVEPADSREADFKYRIFNADGGEVEQCGNGARCFVKFVYNNGLTDKKRIRAKTMKGVIELELKGDGMVRVSMGIPSFEPLCHSILKGSLLARFAALSSGRFVIKVNCLVFYLFHGQSARHDYHR